jgi:hypothetical protein
MTDGGKREVVCLCGSTRFKDTYREENARLTMEGKVVLSVGLFGHAEDYDFTEEQKEMLDSIHLDKIDMADRVHVINVDGYIGESTQNELRYAAQQNKKITFYDTDWRNRACPYCGAPPEDQIPAWDGESKDGLPDYLGCTDCGTMGQLGEA